MFRFQITWKLLWVFVPKISSVLEMSSFVVSYLCFNEPMNSTKTESSKVWKCKDHKSCVTKFSAWRVKSEKRWKEKESLKHLLIYDVKFVTESFRWKKAAPGRVANNNKVKRGKYSARFNHLRDTHKGKVNQTLCHRCRLS